MLRTVRVAVAIALVSAMTVAGVSNVAAATIDECQGQLSQLRADTAAAEGAFASARSFESALAKLDAAAAKLAEGKTADAAAKIRDFQGLLSSLTTAPKPKVEPSVAEQLTAEAQNVIGCIESIGTE